MALIRPASGFASYPPNYSPSRRQLLLDSRSKAPHVAFGLASRRPLSWVMTALGPQASRQDAVRHAALAAFGACVGGMVQGTGMARAEGLGSRFTTDIIKSPGVAGIGSPKLVFLPKWLMGTWNTSMSFVECRFPLGTKYVSPQLARSGNAVAAAKEVTFPLRFYSIQPDTTENKMRAMRGDQLVSEVVPDRVYNTRTVIEAYYGYPAVGEILYDPDTNPLRMQILFSSVGPDMQPLPRRRQELFINNIKFESPDDTHYVCSEFIRTVTLGRAVAVSDSETLTSYERQPNGDVVGKQRVAIYLTPNPNNQEGAMYFETGGKAVALFDYKFRMTRIGDADGSVVTPQREVQNMVAIPTAI